MSAPFLIVGQIVGVNPRMAHGLRVDVVDVGRKESIDRLTVDRHGRFRGHLAGVPTDLKDRKSFDVQVQLLDRTGSPVSVRGAGRRRVTRGRRSEIEVAVTRRSLVTHTRAPLSWTRPDVSVLNPVVLGEITDALGRIAAPGSPRHIEMMQSMLCPAPYVQDLDRLIRLGWDVLEGQPGAADAMRHDLRLIDVARPGRSVTPGTGPWDRMRASAERGGSERRTMQPLVPMEHIAPLMMAVGEIAGGESGLMGRFVDSIGHMLCGVAAVASIGDVARDVLRGTPGAIDALESGILDFAAFCGPDDGPGGARPHVCPPMDDLIDPRCAAQIVNLMPSITPPSIVEVDPPRACPGEQITLRGFGFGTNPFHVAFGRHGAPGETVTTTADSWSDTEIIVTVPDGAGCGVRAITPTRTHHVCGRFVDSDHADGSELFEGTSPEILHFAVGGPLGTGCVAPGEVLTVAWRVCAADLIEIRVRNEVGTLVRLHSTAEPAGSFELSIQSSIGNVRQWEVDITATGTCEPTATELREVLIHHRPDLSIDGIEVTQAIQHYRSALHLTKPEHQLSDNAAELVIGKSAWVRVYVRSGLEVTFSNGVVPGVDGTLHVERIVGNGTEPVSGVERRDPTTIDAQADFATYDDERGSIDTSINFWIPADEMHGRLRLSATAFVAPSEPVAHCGGATANYTLPDDIFVDLDQTLTVRGIPVAYSGPAFGPNNTTSLPARSLADLEAGLDLTRTILPISADIDVDVTPEIDIGFTLDGDRTSEGGCSLAWHQFLSTELLPAKLADGNPNAVYYGMTPVGLPATPGGCASFGVTGGTLGQGTLAHEITHNLGRSHTPCDVFANADLSHPAYEPYDPPGPYGAHIGEYGLDIRSGTIHPPTEYDYMSYCNPDWISLHTHAQLQGTTPLLQSGAGGGGGSSPVERAGGDRGYRPIVMITCVIGERDAVDVRRVARFTTRPELRDVHDSGLVAELLEGGRVIASSPVLVGTAEGCGCGCSGGCGGAGASDELMIGQRISGQQVTVGAALLDDRTAGDTLRIRREAQVVWQRSAPAAPPTVAVRRVGPGDADTIEIDWDADTFSDTKPRVWARWSPDGVSWRLLASSLKVSPANVDRASVPAGRVFVQVMVDDGFHTTTSQPMTVDLKPRPPRAVIVAPSDGASLTARRDMRVAGAVGADDGAAKITWTLDGKQIGDRREFWIAAPRAGRHTLELSVNRDGRTTRRAITLTTKR